MATIQVSTVKSEFAGPPPVANFVGTTLANDVMILAFAFVDPSTAPQGGPDETIQLVAKAFSQIVVPRSAFAVWLTSAIRLISGLGDRDTFGWSEIVRVVNEVEGERAKK